MKKPQQNDGRVHGAIVGVRRGDGRWLLIRRSRTLGLAPLKVCFPGGTVERGEDRLSAARREFREELGVPVRIIRPVWHHIFDDRPLTLWGYLGELVDDNLVPDVREVEETLWLTASEAAAHPDGLPGTAIFIERLEAAAAVLIDRRIDGVR